MANQGISLRPSDAAVGGFLDSTEATLRNVRFVDSYPNGTKGTLLSVTFVPDGGDRERTELYSVSRGFSVVNGGKGIKPDVEGSRPRKDCNAMRFLASLVQGGFPESQLGDDVTVIDGTRAFLRRESLPKFKDQTKDRDILLVQKVLGLPGDGKKAGGGVKKPAAVASKPAAKVSSTDAAVDTTSIEAEAVELVAGVLAEAPDNTIERKKLGTTIFNIVVKAKNPRRQALMALIAKDDFVAAEGRPWAYDSESGTLVGMPQDDTEAA